MNANNLCCNVSEKQQSNMQCPDSAKITNAIIEFVTHEEGADVETLRKALYCQVGMLKLLNNPLYKLGIFCDII